MQTDNILGLIIVLLPVLLLAYVTCKNFSIGEDKEEKSSDNSIVMNENFSSMEPPAVFSVEKFDNQIEGWNADGLNGSVERMDTFSKDTTLYNVNWIGGMFHNKREEFGKMSIEKRNNVGDLAETNNLVEGFLDVGFGEAIKDGLNTLLGRTASVDTTSVNPDLSYVKTQPDIPGVDPRIESVNDASTAAVKIPVLEDDKQAQAMVANEAMKEKGQSMEDINAKLIADKAHMKVIAQKTQDLIDNGAKFVDDKRRDVNVIGGRKQASVPWGNSKGILQQLYSTGEAEGTIKSGDREFADDADTFHALVQGEIKCEAYPIIRNGQIKQVNISNNGNGYKKAPKIKVMGNCTKEAKLKAVIDESGSVVIIDIIEEGKGYTTTPRIKFV